MAAELATRHWILPYLPGLDGVRALAVGAVLVYHGGIGLPGGFLGVDVFFALSGFLITTLLLGEFERRGHIDLFAFWGRRARRLLPALFLVILAVALYILALAEPDRQAQIRGDALSSLLYLSNWRFVLQGQSYFDQFTSPSPLLHTWSLAIEEQFYLLFPLLLIGLLAWLGLRISRLAPAFVIGALASAALMAVQFTPGTDPSRVYYGTDTRIQTLLLGAAVATVAPALRSSRRFCAVAPYLGALGLVGLFSAFLWLPERSPLLYRGGFLLVAAASLGVILAVYVGRGWVNAWLSWRPLVALGVISYGVYLWHWPIYLWLNPDLVGISGVPLLALRIFVTLVVATMSFYFVEAPIRYRFLSDLAPRQRLQAVGAAVVAAVGALFVSTALAPAATASSTTSAASGAGQSRAGTTVFLLGDSNTQALLKGFPADEISDVNLTTSGQLGCGLIVDDHTAEGKLIVPERYCYTWRDRRLREAAQARPEVAVLFAGSWEQYDRVVDGKVLRAGTPEYTDYLANQFVELLDGLHETGARVAFVNDHCHRTPDFGLGPEPRVVNDDARVSDVNAAVELAVKRAKFPVKLIDINGFLCSDGYTNEWDGVTLRSDGLHFTKEGGRIVWQWLAPQLTEKW